MFDVITPSVVLADHTIGSILDNTKAARIVQQNSVDPTIPGLGEVIDRLFDAVFGANTPDPYEAEISRAVEWVAVARVMGLAGGASMPQVRAIALQRLQRRREALEGMTPSVDDLDAAHYDLLSGTIERFLKDPTTAPSLPSPPTAPPGAPIGQGPQYYLAGLGWIADTGGHEAANPWLEAFDLPYFWLPGR
jgi:hypothetical protein